MVNIVLHSAAHLPSLSQAFGITTLKYMESLPLTGDDSI